MNYDFKYLKNLPNKLTATSKFNEYTLVIDLELEHVEIGKGYLNFKMYLEGNPDHRIKGYMYIKITRLGYVNTMINNLPTTIKNVMCLSVTDRLHDVFILNQDYLTDDITKNV